MEAQAIITALSVKGVEYALKMDNADIPVQREGGGKTKEYDDSVSRSRRHNCKLM